MKSVLFALSALLAGALLSTAQADTLRLGDAIAQEPRNAADGLLRPRSGMNKTQVRAKFGEPGETLAAVGEPPISRWVYPSYTVYFEHDLVLNSVVHR